MTGPEAASQRDGEPVLRVVGASRSFGETRALCGVDLELRRGEWVGLLGPNGAGKTTLVWAIAGRVRLDAGRVEIHGREVRAGANPPDRRCLGIVPQEIALYQALTARENLQAFGRLHGVRGRELRDRIAWALQWSGLEKRADQPVQGYSGGMKRRLNIACSILHHPDVLLLDEPTVGVDPQSRQLIWEMLEAQRQAGTTLLLTTHQLDEAATVCERIVIIDHGQVIADGTLPQLIADTVGDQGHLQLRLDRPLPAGSPLFERWVATADGAEIQCAIGDLTHDLPALLANIVEADRTVLDMHLVQPSLHTVFLELTGRELRE